MSSSRPQPHHSSSSFGNGSTASSILGAFGRRPRTATNSRDRQGQATGTVTDYAGSTDDLNQSGGGSNQPVNRSRISLVARSGLPRSNSSSQISRVLSTESSSNNNNNNAQGSSNHRFAFPSSNNTNSGEGARRPGMTSHNSFGNGGSRPGTGNGEETSSSGFPRMMRTNSSQGNGGNGSAIGRYFRRYSQGAGKNMAAANEAYAVAEASNANASANNGVGGSGGNQSGFSALSASQTMPVLPSLNLHDASGLSGTEGATASLALMDGNGDDVNSATRATSAATPTATGLQNASTHRIRLVPHLEATRSLHFEPIERDLVEGAIAVKIGRFTDRANPSTSGATGSGFDSGFSVMGGGGNASALGNTAPGSSLAASSSTTGVPGARGGAIPSSAGGGGRVDSGRIAFKSKVVSRGHAEVWCEAGGKFFIRDTKSSSGTFLNHIRLSHPNIESKPFPVKDGDVVQLGVDYQGGTEEIYRCVKMRVELNRGWQRGANQFNVNALRQLRALQGSPLPDPVAVAGKTAAPLPTNRQSMNVTDCCICLFSVTVCQALFIAPCSHVFHFKCIRPLIEQHHPGFSCPLCRTFADLNADVEEDEAWQQTLLKEAQGGGVDSTLDMANVSTPMVEDPVPPFSNLVITNPSSPLASHTPITTTLPTPTVPSLPTLPQNTSSLLRMMQASGSVEEGQQSSLLSGERRRSSASNTSPSPRRGSETKNYSNRPETAISSTTAVPSPPPPTSNAGHALHNVMTAGSPGRSTNELEEDEEVMYEAPSTSSYSRRPSAPINISGSSGSAAGSSSHFRIPSNDGFTTSPSFIDARTPQNNHFLSTLAEAPPPSRSAIRAMEPTMGDNTLFPNNGLFAEERRVSNATNNSSIGGEGVNDIYSTPAQGNSPPNGSSPLSATARSHNFDDDGSGSGEGNTPNASIPGSTPKGKSPDTAPPHLPLFSSSQQQRDGTTGGINPAALTGGGRRTTRESSVRDSIGSSDRGSSGNRSQVSREGNGAATSGKVARFFKRSSSAIGN